MEGFWMGFRGGFSGLDRADFFFLEQYARQIIITNRHTKSEVDSSKRLEVIPS